MPASVRSEPHLMTPQVDSQTPCRLATLVLVALLGACATNHRPPSEREIGAPGAYATSHRVSAGVHRVEVQASVQRVADELPVVYQRLGLPVVPDQDGGPYTFTTPSLRIEGQLYEGERNSLYFDCGSSMTGTRADDYELTFTVVTELRALEQGGTLAETTVDGSARDRYASSDPVPCQGTGKLEAQIARGLQERSRTR